MTTATLLLSTFLGCFAGALIPAVNSEAVILSATALAPWALAAPLALVATVGQLSGKVLLYLAGRGLLRLPHGKVSARVDGVVARLQSRQGASGSLLFVSAFAGIPPFFVVSVACGVLKLSFTRFLALGFLGRLLRFSCLALLPQLARIALT